MHKISLGFFDGSLLNPGDDIIMGYSMDKTVHAEIWFNNMRITSCALFEHSVVCFPKGKYDCQSDRWHSIPIPITDPGKALEFFERASASEAPYHIPVTDFLVPKGLVDYIDKDEDCEDPMAWKKLFCSKFALLFLRYCDHHGIIDAPGNKLNLLWSVNSNRCSPALLKQMITEIFGNASTKNI